MKMQNGKRRVSENEDGILVELSSKRVRHELVAFENQEKDGQLMEVEVGSCVWDSNEILSN